MEGFVTLLFIKVEEQNLAEWDILTCIFQKTIYFRNSGLLWCHYDVIIGVYEKDLITLPFLNEEAQKFCKLYFFMCFPRKQH